MIAIPELEAALKDHLPGQRWFGSKDRELIRVRADEVEVLKDEWPALVRIEAEAIHHNDDRERYQVLMGLRPPASPASFLEESSTSVIGEFDTDKGPCYGYDALCDPELALALFGLIAPEGEKAERVRPMGAEQSNTSLIFDERLVLKVLRKITEGRSLELEMTSALNRVGFPHVAGLVAEWRSETSDLGLIERFLVGGVDGRALAITSLRDYFNHGEDPSQAGGDFAAEAERLGQMTAEMHIALARAFGARPGDPAGWADVMDAQLERISHPGLNKEAAKKVFDDLRQAEDPGPSLRVHGDFHLGQVVRSDEGWFVFDFEGEPARPLYERRLLSSPIKDVAGMLRSLQYAVWGTMADQQTKPFELGDRWEARNRQAFLDGYVARAHYEQGILPGGTASLDVVLRAFELDKAIYEIGYELAHRPDWVEIPLAALPRLL